MWARFYDVKGGEPGYNLKVGFKYVYVELDLQESVRWFEHRFDRNPFAESYRCSGPDFGHHGFNSLGEAIKFSIPATFNTTTEFQHMHRADVLVVYASEAQQNLADDGYPTGDQLMDQLKALKDRMTIAERKFDERMSELKMRISNSIDYLQDGMDTAEQASAAITKLDIMYPQLVSEELRRQGWVLRGRKDVYQDTINELNELFVQLNGEDEDAPF